MEVDLEVEKMLIFVASTLGHDIDYLNRTSVVTFYQLLTEADKVQRSRQRDQPTI